MTPDQITEARALVGRLDDPWSADDGLSEKGGAPIWCGIYMQEAKHALTAALDEIERLRVMAYQPASRHPGNCDCGQCVPF